MTDDEKIAEGICVSPNGVDRCPKCTDTCEAAHWASQIREAKKELEGLCICRKDPVDRLPSEINHNQCFVCYKPIKLT